MEINFVCCEFRVSKVHVVHSTVTNFLRRQNGFVQNMCHVNVCKSAKPPELLAQDVGLFWSSRKLDDTAFCLPPVSFKDVAQQ